jgi:hypothetical protein
MCNTILLLRPASRQDLHMLIRLKATLVAIAVLGSLGLFGAAPATAITGGTEDSANQYSNVGLVVFYEADGRFRCTGTLVTTTVVITAAHCTSGTVGKTIITFNPVIARQPPSNLPRATDDAGTGTSSIGYQSGQALPVGYYIGTPVAHPGYSNFTDLKNWNDVGVVVLDRAVTGITPARLAPTNYLNQFAQPALNHETFTLVGYGTEVRKNDTGPQTPIPQSYPIVRRYTDEVGQKLTPQILQTNGNENDTRGGGGTCFGDSGGPSFKGGYVTTVTSYGYTNNCRYIGGLQRVDIPVVQTWLAAFGVLPAA